jgi:hypothetical protein
MFLPAARRHKAAGAVLHTLDMVGLQSVARRRVSGLSHGMIKRLGVAQAFLGHPEVILLDEPTAGLDPANARQVRDLVKQLQERATILVSSHNLAEIQELCDHVAILDHGRMVLAGSVDEITRSNRECELDLSRPLQEAGCSASTRFAACGASSRPLLGEPRKPQCAIGRYLVKFDLSADGIDQDAVIAALLKTASWTWASHLRDSPGASWKALFGVISPPGYRSTNPIIAVWQSAQLADSSGYASTIGKLRRLRAAAATFLTLIGVMPLTALSKSALRLQFLEPSGPPSRTHGSADHVPQASHAEYQ